MKRRFSNAILLVIILIVFLSLAGYFGIKYFQPSGESASNSAITTITQRPGSPAESSDVPSLYSGVKWGKPESGKYLFPDSQRVSVSLHGYAIKSEVFNNSVLSDQFFSYYDKELTSNGWIIDQQAGGGAGGETRTFKKINNYFMLRSSAISNPPVKYQLIITYTK